MNGLRAADAVHLASFERIYQQSCDNKPAVRRMNFVNAELTKISVNTFVTTKISYANMLADICDRLPEADVDVVTQAVGSDTRIGNKYLRGAIGFGQPGHPVFNAVHDLALGRDGSIYVAETRTKRVVKLRPVS